MPTPATAEPQQQSRNHPMQDNNTAVLDGPDKNENTDAEQQSTAPESGGAGSLAPNPTDGLSMAGNTPAEPVAAMVSRAAPAVGNAPASTSPETDQQEEPGAEGQREGKEATAGSAAGGGSDGAGSGGDSGAGSDAGGSTGAGGPAAGALAAGAPTADASAAGSPAAEGDNAEGKQGEGEGEEKENKEKSGEGGGAEGGGGAGEEEGSGSATGASVKDFQESGKALDAAAVKPVVSDAEKDPAFQGVVKHTETARDEQNTHLPSDTKLAETKAATPLSNAEQDSKNDQKGHIASMNALAEEESKKKEPFTPAKFKGLLQGHLKTLSDQMPNSEASAKRFKRNKPVEKMKENIAGEVKSENEKLSGPMSAQAEQPEPPASGVAPDPMVPVPKEEVGPVPPKIAPDAAVPKKKNPSEISVKKESQSLDDAMAANDVTDEQLAKSNEPAFLEAKQSKDDAKSQADALPGRYREIESQQLDAAKQQAEASSQQGMQEMHIARTSALGQVLSTQQTTGQSDQDKQKEIYGKLETIYNNTKDQVKKKLDGLSEKVDEIFSGRVEQAKKTFEENVEERLDDIYGITVIDDWLFGEDTEAIEKAFRIEKRNFESTMNRVIDDLAKLIANELNATIDIIKKGKKDADDFFNTLDTDQQKLAQDAFDNFNDQYDSLEDTVYEKQEELAQDLARSYKENVDSLRETFDKIKDEVSAGWIGAAFDAIAGVIETILKIKDMLLNLLSAVLDAIGTILSDPIGFLSNLISGIKLGFENFGKNLLNNIMTGLIEWLTGSLGGVGITIPDNLFSLSGIFDLVAQILGLTWDYFREKAVKYLGEPMVQAMETGFEIFMIIREKGMEGLWEYIKDQFNDLKEMVMDAIRDMIITKVIEAGIKWILGLMSPAGAFVKAAMMIIDIAKFFIERAAQIIDLVNAFVEGIRALASGNVSAVAKAVENALVKAIPILIGFLASLVGITGLTQKVQKIIGGVRKRVDRVIEKVIKKGKKAFGKLMGKKKPKKGDAKKIKEDNKKGKPEEITAEDKKEHKRIGKAIKKQLMARQAKKGETFDQFHASQSKESEDIEDAHQPKLKKGINLDIAFKPVASDKKDNDVDVTITIAPNKYEENVTLFFDPEVKSYKEDIKRAINRVFKSSGGDIDLNFLVSALKGQMAYLDFVIDGDVANVFDKSTGSKVGQITAERYKSKIKPESFDEEIKEINKSKLTEKEKQEFRDEVEERRLHREVFEDLKEEKEVIKDDWAKQQYIDRYQKRYVNYDDHEKARKSKAKNIEEGFKKEGIAAKGTMSEKMQNILGDRTGGGRISVTSEKEHQITGGYTGRETRSEYPEPTFNSLGAVDIDMAKIPKETEIHDVSTPYAAKELMKEAGKGDNDRIKPDAEIRGLVDVRRTKETLVAGDIPGRAIMNYDDKETVDKKLPKKIVEKVDKDGLTLKERIQETEGKKNIKTKEGLERVKDEVKFEVKDLSKRDKDK